MTKEFRYRAFISYSHKDEKWASWLHRALETYKVPSHLVGQTTPMGQVPKRIGKVFRDREELSTSHSLGTELTQALEDSACQIVICSPSAATSHWTNEEILTYKRLGREHRIYCLIVGGEPGSDHAECFPPAVKFRMGGDGELSDQPAEPIAADARAHGDGKQNAKLKLISGMLGVSFDSLKQREHQRRQRRLMIVTAASLAGMVLTSGLAALAIMARNDAEVQRNQAQIEAETARQTTSFLVDLFEVSGRSEVRGNTITAREILDRGAERIATELVDQPEIQATLMDTMGTVYTSLGLYEPAESLVGQAMEKRVELFGERHPDVLRSLNHLGEVQILRADYENAEKNLRESLTVRRDIDPNGSAALADTISDLAEALTLQGEYDESEALIRESLAIRRALYGNSHEDVAASIEALGLNKFDQGDLDGALAELRAAVTMRRELHGERHPKLASAIGNLALAVFEMGEMPEAEDLYQEALDMQRALHGESHPEVASALNNVGVTRWQRGDFDGAEAAYTGALDIQRELLGEDHPAFTTTLFNIALIRYDRGDVNGAIDMMRRTLRIRRDALGAEHPDVASSAINLGLWLTSADAFDEALPLIDEAISIRQQAFGDDHPRTAVARVVKANFHIATGRQGEARELARHARMSLLDSLPEDHWLVAYASSAEGAALSNMGSHSEAEPLLLSSLAPLELAPIPGVLKQHRQRLASLYSAWGKPDKAATYRTEN